MVLPNREPKESEVNFREAKKQAERSALSLIHAALILVEDDTPVGFDRDATLFAAVDSYRKLRG
jgi:hypothetical protein